MLTVRGLCAGYGAQDVLHDISFDASPGESIAIIGPNGSGKSTLLHVLAGLLAYRGDVQIMHSHVRRMRPPKMAQYVTLLAQSPPAAFSYSAFDTVMMGRFAHRRSIFGGPAADDVQAVNQALETVGLAHMRDVQITKLSGGMLQRVFLARALAQDSPIFLLDEPTNHLDLAVQIDIVQHLRAWVAQKNRLLISVMHDINMALSLGDRYIALSDGRIADMGAGRPSDTVLSQVFGIDVAAHMRSTLSKWTFADTM